MFSRIATRILLSLSTSATLLVSFVVVMPARSQALPELTAATTTVFAPAISGRFIVVYRSGQLPANVSSAAASIGAHLVERHDLLGISVLEQVSDAARAQLALDPNVEAIVPDLILNAHAIIATPVSVSSTAATLSSIPDALYHSPQGWAVRQVGGFGADGTATAPKGPWNTTQGKGVRIAILDTGVDPNHPDIAPNLAFNLSEINQKSLPSACDDGSPLDQTGHGTWTASLAAGALGANTGLVAGVAPQATILNIKVLQRMPAAKTAADPSGCLNGQASGLLSWVLQGIEDAVANRADIISMSLGTLVDITTGDGAGDQAIFNRATQAAYNAGIVLIAAAGNDGFNLANQRYIELPAQSRDVLAIVASTNPACAQNLKTGATCLAGAITLPYYSNYGAPLNALAAPGGSYPAGGASNPTATSSIPSGWVTGACSSGKLSTLSGLPDATHSLGCFNLGHTPYVQAMGTSASAPLVAGAAALILSAHPTWQPAAVIQALRTSASASTTALPAPQVNVSTLLTVATK
jgi:lantibiotic leader peptide-processing serine protease